MPHSRPTLTPQNTSPTRVNWRAVATLIGDAIGAVSIFAGGYGLLLIGHGLGLN